MRTLAERFPSLKAAWEAYYGPGGVAWEDVLGVKMRRDGCYCVVRFRDPPYTTVADFTRGSTEAEWQVQNDAHDEVTDAEWKALRVVPDCDWFEIPTRKEEA